MVKATSHLAEASLTPNLPNLPSLVDSGGAFSDTEFAKKRSNDWFASGRESAKEPENSVRVWKDLIGD